MPTIVINETPIETKHVAWFTRGTPSNVSLFELVQRTYLYAENMIKSFQLEEVYIGMLPRTDSKAASWILLEATQNTVENEQKKL